jgi:peptidoglycan/xylan/chitin deacetylase (PgdA/CDA1 family)
MTEKQKRISQRLLLRVILVVFILLIGTSAIHVIKHNQASQITSQAQVSRSVIMKIAAIPAAPSQKSVTSIPILYYHSIAKQPGNPIRIPPQQFEEQMKYLADHGYEILGEDQFYDCLVKKKNFPEKSVVITLDDGYGDNFTNAFPIMRKYKFVGTVFMVPSYIDGPGYLTGDQLKKLQAAGWTIGGHTEHHTNLIKVSAAAAVQELQTSNRTLEDLLGQSVKTFAYPYGGYSPQVTKLVQKFGYRTAYTTQKGWAKAGADPLTLPRVYCYTNMGIKEFARRLTYFNY